MNWAGDSNSDLLDAKVCEQALKLILIGDRCDGRPRPSAAIARCMCPVITPFDQCRRRP